MFLLYLMFYLLQDGRSSSKDQLLRSMQTPRPPYRADSCPLWPPGVPKMEAGLQSKTTREITESLYREMGMQTETASCTPNETCKADHTSLQRRLDYHISHWSLGKGTQRNPTRPTRDYLGLLGLSRAYWKDLAPFPQALMASMIKSSLEMPGAKGLIPC